MIRKYFLQGIIRSYGQIFFSESLAFSVLLLLVSFIDIWAGFCGLASVIIANTTAWWLGFNKQKIYSGLYGFNSLFVGLALGVRFAPGYEIFALVAFGALLTFFFVVFFEGLLTKYQLPFLSFPFLIAVWVVLLTTWNMQSLEPSQENIFIINKLYRLGGSFLVDGYYYFSAINLPEGMLVFLKSLGAIFFQNNLLAGLLIGAGLLASSRIAFLLSVTGFTAAYYYYQLIGANLGDITHSYIGFNFILTAIAAGGYFSIPSKRSFAWVLAITPVTAMLISGSSTALHTFGLPAYSLAFNLIIVIFLFVLRLRETESLGPTLALTPQKPENNLYLDKNNKIRFGSMYFTPIFLPFWGKWLISQAHEGEITHREDWKHAWDFVIADSNGQTWKNNGSSLEDYFCYNKPVTAPADGYIQDIIDNIPDNTVGEVNLEQNWGNCIIIRHHEHLYSKLCHLKEGSFKYKKGDFVTKGSVLALCGNSGRSPEPHLHFQLQPTPFAGSKTLKYPIAHYIEHNQQKASYNIFSIPEKNQWVSNIEPLAAIQKAYSFIPGQVLIFSQKELHKAKNQSKDYQIEVMVDPYNQPYLYCHTTKAYAYFFQDDNVFYFTSYYGKKSGFLFWFYLSNYRIIKGFYQGLVIDDFFPVNVFKKSPMTLLQDFTGAFYMFMKVKYSMVFDECDNMLEPENIRLKSQVGIQMGKKLNHRYSFATLIKHQRVNRLIVESSHQTLEFTCTE